MDIGCGTGKMAKAALAQFNIDQLICCDCSKEMIEIAKKRCYQENVSFLTADLRALSYNQSFNVISAVLVHHYLKKEERALAIKNCYQALKPGGLFFNVENFAPFSDVGERLYLDRWQSYQLKQGKDNEECRRHISRYKTQYFPITLSEHLAIMRQSGFLAAEIFWLSYMQVGVLGVKQ